MVYHLVPEIWVHFLGEAETALSSTVYITSANNAKVSVAKYHLGGMTFAWLATSMTDRKTIWELTLHCPLNDVNSIDLRGVRLV